MSISTHVKMYHVPPRTNDDSCGNLECFSYKSWNMFCPIPPTNTTVGKYKTKERRPHSLFPNTNRLSLLPFPFCLGPPPSVDIFSDSILCAKEENCSGGRRQIGGDEEDAEFERGGGNLSTPLPPFSPTNPRHFFTSFLVGNEGSEEEEGDERCLPSCWARTQSRRGERGNRFLSPHPPVRSSLPAFASRQVHELQVYMALMFWPIISFKSWVAPFHGVRVASNDKTCWQILILAWPGWLYNISARDCKNCVTNSNIRIIEKANNWCFKYWMESISIVSLVSYAWGDGSHSDQGSFLFPFPSNRESGGA